MSDFTKPIEDIASEVKDYVDLQMDDVKLRTVRGLTLTASKLLSLILITGIVSALLLVLSFGLILLLGAWIGSYGGAAMIVAGVLAIILIILLIIKDKPFRGAFVGLFVKMFFDGKDELPVDPKSR